MARPGLFVGGGKVSADRVHSVRETWQGEAVAASALAATSFGDARLAEAGVLRSSLFPFGQPKLGLPQNTARIRAWHAAKRFLVFGP